MKINKNLSPWRKKIGYFSGLRYWACLTCTRWAEAITQLRFITQSELLTQSPAADQDILRTNHYCHWCVSKESWVLKTIALYLKSIFMCSNTICCLDFQLAFFEQSMNLEICVASSLSKWEMMQVILHGLTLNKQRKISREDVLFIAKRIQVVILNSQWEMWENDLMKDLVISAFVVIQRLAIIH